MRSLLVRLCICTCIIAVFGAQARSSNRTHQRITQIAKTLLKGDTKASIIKLSKFLNSKNKNSFARVHYLLGLAFSKLELKQTAINHFYQSILAPKNKDYYAYQSLSRLILLSSETGDDFFIKKSLPKIPFKNIQKSKLGDIYYALGSFYLEKNELKKALKFFLKVPPRHWRGSIAKYQVGMLQTQLGHLNAALRSFRQLSRGAQAHFKEAGLLGLARVYYQKKNWRQAVNFYSKISRNSIFWIQSLREVPWALIQLKQPERAIRHFHTLHSDYYKNLYIPETFVLRAVVYFQICHYEELKKVLYEYKNIYHPILSYYRKILKKKSKYYHYNLFISAQNQSNRTVPESVKTALQSNPRFRAPALNISWIIKERKALKRAFANYNSRFARKKIDFLNKVLKFKKQNFQALIKNHIVFLNKELLQLEKQREFLEYEILKYDQSQIKKRISQKKLGIKIDREREQGVRDFYIQNGFEYWPFQGEYWLDELGNYYYIGKSYCEQ